MPFRVPDYQTVPKRRLQVMSCIQGAPAAPKASKMRQPRSWSVGNLNWGIQTYYTDKSRPGKEKPRRSCEELPASDVSDLDSPHLSSFRWFFGFIRSIEELELEKPTLLKILSSSPILRNTINDYPSTFHAEARYPCLMGRNTKYQWSPLGNGVLRWDGKIWYINDIDLTLH
jgi:hypothetical protein